MVQNICVLITITLTAFSQAADYSSLVSPCPDVFNYEPLGTDDPPLAKRWYGVIKLSTEVRLHALWLNVILNGKADILGNWVGEVSTRDNVNFKVENDNMQLVPGEPKTIRFFIQYSQEKRPELKSILFNGREICNVLEDDIADITNNETHKKADTIKTTARPTDVITTGNVYDRLQTEAQNRLTTKSLSGFYAQTTTEKIKTKPEPTYIDNKVHSWSKTNLTESASTRKPPNKQDDGQQNIRSQEKNVNKAPSSQDVQPTSQIKATVYQQALIDKLPNSTNSNTQLNYVSGVFDNSSTPVNKQQDSGKPYYQQLRPESQSKLGSTQTTTERIWSAVTYPSSTKSSTVTPINVHIRPDDKTQVNSGVSETYDRFNNHQYNIAVPVSDTSQASTGLLPGNQIGVSNLIVKDVNTVSQTPINMQRGQSGNLVPIQTINSPQNLDDRIQGDVINRELIGTIPMSGTDSWSQKPSQLSYGATGSQFADRFEEEHRENIDNQSPSNRPLMPSVPQPATVIEDAEDEQSIISGLPIYIPNFKPDEMCGKVIKKAPQELPFDSTTYEGQWPWQTALYQQQTVHFKYICGGTLVSHNHIITAAHCVTRRRTMRPVNKHTLTVHLGKFNLRTSVEGVQVRFVEEITVYPSYNSTTYSKDLAILELREPAMFTQWVRPACLWPDDEINLSSIAGRIGSVVGWGVEVSGVQKAELNLLEMPIVDQQTCINSYNMYERFSSAHTFCARYKDDNQVCNGDSGGGMVLRRGTTWYLRGVASIAVASQAEDQCDSKHFIIFTDVAKFLPWIFKYVDL